MQQFFSTCNTCKVDLSLSLSYGNTRTCCHACCGNYNTHLDLIRHRGPTGPDIACRGSDILRNNSRPCCLHKGNHCGHRHPGGRSRRIHCRFPGCRIRSLSPCKQFRSLQTYISHSRRHRHTEHAHTAYNSRDHNKCSPFRHIPARYHNRTPRPRQLTVSTDGASEQRSRAVDKTRS